jgi:hypothetical protein
VSCDESWQISSDFIFDRRLIPLNKFTTVHCTEVGIWGGGDADGAEDRVDRQTKRVDDEKRSTRSYASSGCEVGWTWLYRSCNSVVHEKSVQVLWAIMSVDYDPVYCRRMKSRLYFQVQIILLGS